MPWDDDFLGARASRPHKAWHSFAYLPHFDQPGTAPLHCLQSLKLSGRQAANAAGCLQRRWPGWRREASLSSQAHPGGEPRSRGWVRSARDWRGRARWQGQDAGGTPALPGDAIRLRGGGVWRATSLKSDVRPGCVLL